MQPLALCSHTPPAADGCANPRILLPGPAGTVGAADAPAGPRLTPRNQLPPSRSNTRPVCGAFLGRWGQERGARQGKGELIPNPRGASQPSCSMALQVSPRHVHLCIGPGHGPSLKQGQIAPERLRPGFLRPFPSSNEDARPRGAGSTSCSAPGHAPSVSMRHPSKGYDLIATPQEPSARWWLKAAVPAGLDTRAPRDASFAVVQS